MKKMLSDMFFKYGAMGSPLGLAIILGFSFFCGSTDRAAPEDLTPLL
jgi:hypothetical protein